MTALSLRPLSRDQVRAIDRRAVEEFGLPSIVLMENAARAVADAAMEELGSPAGRVLVVAGAGNNGGDGFAAARHLHNHGVEVRINLCCPRDKVAGDALINLFAVENMNLPLDCLAEGPALDHALLRARMAGCDLVIDALLGTGMSGEVRPPLTTVIEAMNAAGKPILAVDIPSGLDCDTGRPLGVAVRAARTVTFVAPKLGFANPEAATYTGRVTVGDIGAPRSLWETP